MEVASSHFLITWNEIRFDKNNVGLRCLGVFASVDFCRKKKKFAEGIEFV